MTLDDRLEWNTPADPARNYCLWDYTPVAPPEDKFRSVNLLYQSFEAAGVGDRAYAFVDALRESLGPFQTVYGVKWVDGRYAWEFYFYDYARLARTVSATRALAALAPLAGSDVQVDESLPYFMFSIDLDADLVAGRRAIDVVHLYIGHPGSAVSSGIAYAQTAQGRRLENLYAFFDARSQQALAADKIACSAHLVAGRHAIDEVLLPGLRDCHTLCVANKAHHDCIYFSGVDIDALAGFLDRFGYPASTRAFVAQHRERLDHLLFDVGFDYRADGERLLAVKSGFYGVF